MPGDDGGRAAFGRQIFKLLLSEPGDFTVIPLARSSPRVDELRALPGAREGLAIADTDLASLICVDRACEEVGRRLGGRFIDALVLNAGIQTVAGDQASADGLELTFAVNFLAHFLIAERLKGRPRPGARINHHVKRSARSGCLLPDGDRPGNLARPVGIGESRTLAGAHEQHRRARGGALLRLQLLNLMHVRHLARVASQWCGRLQSERAARHRHRARSQLAAAAGLEVSHAPVGSDPAGGARWAGQPAICFGSSPTRTPFAFRANTSTARCRVQGRESRDPAKIMRAVEVAREIIAHAVDRAQPLAAERA
jgi:short subunit dehydrogenase